MSSGTAGRAPRVGSEGIGVRVGVYVKLEVSQVAHLGRSGHGNNRGGRAHTAASTSVAAAADSRGASGRVGHRGPGPGPGMQRRLGEVCGAGLVLLLLVLGDGGSCCGCGRLAGVVERRRERGRPSQRSEAGGTPPPGVPATGLLAVRRREGEALERGGQRRRCRVIALP